MATIDRFTYQMRAWRGVQTCLICAGPCVPANMLCYNCAWPDEEKVRELEEAEEESFIRRAKWEAEMREE